MSAAFFSVDDFVLYRFVLCSVLCALIALLFLDDFLCANRTEDTERNACSCNEEVESATKNATDKLGNLADGALLVVGLGNRKINAVLVVKVVLVQVVANALTKAMHGKMVFGSNVVVGYHLEACGIGKQGFSCLVALGEVEGVPALTAKGVKVSRIVFLLVVHRHHRDCVILDVSVAVLGCDKVYHRGGNVLVGRIVIAVNGSYEMKTPVTVDADNIFVEAIKPCEDTQKAFIVRMYEAEGARTNAVLSFPGAAKCEITNMIEETQSELTDMNVTFRPFEIKTIKVYY